MTLRWGGGGGGGWAGVLGGGFLVSMKVEHFQSGNKKGQHSKTLPERMKLEFIFLRQEQCS